MNSTNLSVDARELKKRFCKIYEYVITNNFAFDAQLISGAKETLNSMKGQIYKTDLPSYQLAFLLSFGVQDTCLSAQNFYESFKDYTKIFDSLFKNRRIKLCCLESESLPTVVGVCQVIDDIVKQFRGSFDFSEIQVSVVDKKRQNWRRLCECIADTVNSYFKNIELKLDFVEDCTSGSSEVLIDRIKESDLVVIARTCTETISGSSFLQIVLKEMKENSIMFYLDSSCEKTYEDLIHSFSSTNLFTEVKCCQTLNASFEDLKNEQHCLDLPINWDTNFQPIMFLIWTKRPEIKVNSLEKKDVQASTDIVSQSDISSEQTIVPKAKKKGKSSKHLNLDVSASTNTEVNLSKKGNKSRTPSVLDNSNKQMNGMNTNRNAESLPKSQYVNASSIAFILKKIPKAECQTNTLTTFNCENFLTAETILPTTKTKAMTSKTPEALEKIFPNQANSAILIENRNALTSAVKVTPSKKENINKSSKKSDEKNTASKKKASEKDNVAKSSSKNVSVPAVRKSPAVQIANGNASPSIKKVTASKKEDKDKSSKISVTSNASSKKKVSEKNDEAKSSSKNVSIPATQKILAIPIANGNASSLVAEPTASKKENKEKSSEKPGKNNSASETTTSKGKGEAKTSSKIATQKVESKKASRVKLTKKSSKNIATEKVKLTGKFARMDLEKRNKDERHRMRAKQASFLKHANFDYDD